MKIQGRATAEPLNREIVDDRDGRLSIHTHEIRLTQDHLPYRPVAGKRLASEKHFAVFADRIVLAGTLQNPGRDIALNAREIVVETPATLDVAGAAADKDFAPGEAPVQKDAKPGAAGTDGADGTVGGAGGRVAINARRLVGPAQAKASTAAETGAVGAQVFADNPPKIEDAAALPSFVIGERESFSGKVPVSLEHVRLEGLSEIAFEGARFDGGARRVAMRLRLPHLTVSGESTFMGGGRAKSQPFGCELAATAVLGEDGKPGAAEIALSLLSDKPIKVQPTYVDATLPASALQSVRERIAAQAKDAVEALLAAYGVALSKADLTLLAGGGPGGRGQDGHAGNRGEGGADGAKTKSYGIVTAHGYGFPEEAYGHNGRQGGRAGSPGRSGDGGPGGSVALNVVEPFALGVVYDRAGGAGGAAASPGAQGRGGPGGKGVLCHMFEQTTGKHVEDMRAPDGRDGPLGPPAKGKGSQGGPGDAGPDLTVNGAPFDGGAVPPFPIAALAQALSLPQLLITQNATDLRFLNAREEAAQAEVADDYAWLIEINAPFAAGDKAIDPACVAPPDQAVRAGIHNSAVVSLMRLQQGLDFFGHSYNWTPILNLDALVARTGQILDLGKIVEDQYHRYLDRGLSDKERLDAFRGAKREIDRKLAVTLSEIEKLKPQIADFWAEVEENSEDLRRQRTVLVEGQLEFQAELVAYLREQNDLEFTAFLDLLGTVIGCVGGVVSGVGGVKTAFDAVKKAQEFDKKVKGVVEVFKKSKATIEALKKAYESVSDAFDRDNPNAAKLLVDSQEFEDMLDEYLGKFDAAGELRVALDYYRELAQARNMAAYNYTTLVSQMLDLQTQHDQLYSGIQHIEAEMAAHQDNLLPIYTAYLKDAYEEVQRTLLRKLYEENRAYGYWALRDRELTAENLTVATLAYTHQRLIAEIDSFRENNEAFSEFRQKVTVSAERYPNAFAALPHSRSLVFSLDLRREPGFRNMRFVIARAFEIEFPDLADCDRTLFLNLIHSGQAILNSDTDLDKPGAIHAFSHRPRIRLYKIDYADRENTAGGHFGEGDQGYIGLSPFTQWRIDFDLQGNEWLDLASVQAIVLTFEGRMLGPGRRPI